jgi:hypothetical protein
MVDFDFPTPPDTIQTPNVENASKLNPAKIHKLLFIALLYSYLCNIITAIDFNYFYSVIPVLGTEGR